MRGKMPLTPMAFCSQPHAGKQMLCCKFFPNTSAARDQSIFPQPIGSSINASKWDAGFRAPGKTLQLRAHTCSGAALPGWGVGSGSPLSPGGQRVWV